MRINVADVVVEHDIYGEAGDDHPARLGVSLQSRRDVHAAVAERIAVEYVAPTSMR
jgi:hypothetical protein